MPQPPGAPSQHHPSRRDLKWLLGGASPRPGGTPRRWGHFGEQEGKMSVPLTFAFLPTEILPGAFGTQRCCGSWPRPTGCTWRGWWVLGVWQGGRRRQSPHRWGPPLTPLSVLPGGHASQQQESHLPQAVTCPDGTSRHGHPPPLEGGWAWRGGGGRLPQPLRGSLCDGVPQPGPEEPPQLPQAGGMGHSTPGHGGHSLLSPCFPGGCCAKGGGDPFPFFTPRTVLLPPINSGAFPPAQAAP